MAVVETVSSTDAKARLNAVLAEVERTGVPVTITNHGRPVAVLTPVSTSVRQFGRFPGLVVPDDFDAPLPEEEIHVWESAI